MQAALDFILCCLCIARQWAE